MFLKSYCSISFIEDILSRSPEIDFLNPNSILAGKSYYELIDLIINGLHIYTDCTPEKLEEKKEKNPYIKFLMKNQRLFSKTSDFTEMQSVPHSFYKKPGSRICLFLLSNLIPSSLLLEGEMCIF